MQNIVTKVDGKKLTIEVDLSKSFGDTKSGKSTMVASTHGNQEIPGTNAKLSLNLYVPKTGAVAKSAGA